MSSQCAAPANLIAVLKGHGLRRDKDDPFLILWAPSSPSHPRNWSIAHKVLDVSIILFLQLFTTALATAGTSMGSFAIPDFGLTRTTSVLVFVLPYQLGRIVGGIAIPPFTETWGRKGVYIGAIWVYSISCVIAGVVPHIAGVVVGRCIGGGMSAVGGAVATGSMQDMFDIKARVWAIYAWCAASVAGLAVGPIYGSYISSSLSWQWAFYIAAIVTFFNGCACFALRESRASRLLELATMDVRRETGLSELRAANPDAVPNFRTFAKTSLIRPVTLLFQEPIVAAVVFMSSLAWSLLFCFTESLSVVYELFGFSTVQTSLFFIPILVGVFAGIPVRLIDLKILSRRQQEMKPLRPEDKITGFAIGAPALAIGLWWFAWTTPQAVHTSWVVSALALIFIGFAVNELDITLAGYLADSYTAYASSAVGSLMIVRASMAGVFPLFAYFMFTGISTNAASSILAAVASVFCIAPWIFIRFGERLRKSSKFASTAEPD